MADRRDVDRRVGHERVLIAAGQSRMAELWPGLAGLSVQAAQNLLAAELVKVLEEFGEVAAVAAADWYAAMRAKEVGEDYESVLETGSPEKLQEYGEKAAGLFDGTVQGAAAAWRVVSEALDRHVHYAGQATVARNAVHDSKPPRFARVPSGGRTCAFCAMLASRGFAYHTRQSAGAMLEFHKNCRCQIVPEWDKRKAHIEGYDPDGLYERYKAAERAMKHDPSRSSGGAAKDITYYMRRAFPEDVKDGVSSRVLGQHQEAFEGTDGTITKAKWENHRLAAIRRLSRMDEVEYEALKKRYPKILLPPETPEIPKPDWPRDLPLLDDKTKAHILFGEWKEHEQRFAGGHLAGYGWQADGTEFPATVGAKDVFSLVREHLPATGLERLPSQIVAVDTPHGIMNIHVSCKKKTGVFRINSAFLSKMVE